MTPHTGQRAIAALALAALGALAGCAGTGGQAQALRYRCEQGIALSVRFVEDTAVLEGRGAQDVLLRDAGGQGAQQAVFSSARVRAEFGLGADARQARVQYFEPPLRVHCVRD